MIKTPVYMDCQATTPVDPRVVETMVPFFTQKFGNAASRQHAFGWEAEAAVEHARTLIAASLHADPREIVFTSGATEANNLAIKGVAEALRSKGNHIITVQTEHKSVLDVCKRLERYGYKVTYLPVDADGILDPARVEQAITPQTILVSVMAANNEIGALQDIAAIGRLCRERGITFHSDATQALGKIPLDTSRSPLDLLSFSSHKLYGPKGIGGLYVRNGNPRVQIASQTDGGGQEHGLRAGTLNVPGIVGFGRAVQLAAQEMESESKRVRGLRDRLWTGLLEKVGRVVLNGHPTKRLPNNLNISILDVEDNALMMSMKDVAMSTGSACSSSSPESSHVLRALQVGRERERSAIRLGIGRFTTEEEIDYVVGRLAETAARLRSNGMVHRNNGDQTVSLNEQGKGIHETSRANTEQSI